MLSNKRHGKTAFIVPFFVCAFCSLFLLRPFFVSAQHQYQYEHEAAIQTPEESSVSKDLFLHIDVVQLIETANSRQLSHSKYWRALLHYKKSIFGVKSLIDDPRFFLALDGKTNPKSELEATIRYIYSFQETGNPVSRFMARYTWLKKELGVSSPYEEVCQKHNEIVTFQDAISVNLIFPTGYINSPASMFGHTLLTVQSKHNPGLLSSAVNYAANTNETFGPLFAFRGIFGFYKGFFSIMPYYVKVQEYSDLENRDIWEYSLNLTREEVQMMLFHIWELDNIYSDYYFFDENCSYNLLYLLEVIRPDARLTDDFFFWVIPIDTLRKVNDAGFINDASFRPSRSTLIQFMSEQLNDDQITAVKAIAHREKEPLAALEASAFNETQKIQILDCASEYIQLRYTDRKYTLQEYQDLFLRVLKVRSTFARSIDYAIPRPPVPESGHYSSRIHVRGGVYDDSNFIDFAYRPAYHDLCDDHKGFIPGSQIIFGEIVFRYYSDIEKIHMQRFDIINIESLSPINPFNKPLSWKVITGFERLPIHDNNQMLLYHLNTGSGYAVELSSWLQLYGMLEFSGLINDGLANNVLIGPGASVGLIIAPFKRIRIRCHINDSLYIFGETINLITVKNTLQYNINQRFSFQLDSSGFYNKRWYGQLSAACIFYFW